MSTHTRSALEADLTSASLDARYRAISYVARMGGPALEGGADAAREGQMDAQAARTQVWLDMHIHDEKLLSGYLSFRQSWSPIFKD